MSICYPMLIPAAAPSGFVGPGDIKSGAVAFWGMRAYNAAYATGSNPCMDVVDRATGVSTTTINILSTGFVDTATLAGLGNVDIAKLYDQTGAGNHLVRTLTATRMQLLQGDLNGLPSMDGTVGSPILRSGNFTQAQPFTISWVGNRTTNTTSFVEGVGGDSGLSLAVGWNNTVNTAFTFAGTVLAGTAGDNAWHAFQSVFNSTSSDICVDGSSNAGNAGTNAWSAQVIELPRVTLLGAKYMEFGIWGSAFSAGDKTAMNANQHHVTNGYNF